MRRKSSPYVSEERQETTRQRAERQRQARRAELTYTPADQARWAANRERVIAEREKASQLFELGWMQSPCTQPQEVLWASLFTAETKEAQKQLVKVIVVRQLRVKLWALLVAYLVASKGALLVRGSPSVVYCLLLV